MKINFIKISNILSFPYINNLDHAPAINFHAQEAHKNLYILIGPNGSGKSNLIEVFNQLFKNILFKRCKFDKNTLKNKNRNNNNVLQVQEQNIVYLNKNWQAGVDNQEILLSIAFNENDYQNFEFILENSTVIDQSFDKYSSTGVKFSDLIGQDKERFKQELQITNVEFLVKRQNSTEKFTIEIPGVNNAQNFIKLYLEYFEFLQKIIEIHNESNEEQWEFLKNTFSLISCYRNYNVINPNYPVGKDDEANKREQILNEHYQDSTLHTQNNDEPVVFKLVKHKLAYEGFSLAEQGHGKPEIEKRLCSSKLCKNINSLLKNFLGLKLDIEISDLGSWTFSFKLKKRSQKIIFQNLSAGQKSIIHLIFSLYGYDIENGLMIIDEPELHLHPQLQYKYLEIIERETKNRDVQFIIATHSPVFVTENTIRNIKRFHFDEKKKATEITSPTITEDEHFLVQELHYTNSAKIFFSNRVILVEGILDEYFFNFYFEYLGKRDYEILNMNGKGRYKTWQPFLNKWGVKVYFIGDWDNVKSKPFNLVDNIWKIKIDEYRDKDRLGGKKTYPEIIALLKADDLTKFKNLNRKINYKKKKGVYILKEGELEDYLGTPKKLESVINFCSRFDSETLQYKREIGDIVEHIFKT